jgi:2',3'-cyclic-nucleotide 2'-phosphodiesterase (5'-nucleotidase family)
MKRFVNFFAPAVMMFSLLAPVLTSPVRAAKVGVASQAIENARPDKEETAWGRVVADAVKAAARADVALLNAGALNKGTLQGGAVEDAEVSALLAFPDDDVVSLSLSGAQLRAALEYAVKDAPTGSSRFLQSSGLTATYDVSRPSGDRVSNLRVKNRDVADGDTFTVAMPLGLAKGGAGFYTVWDEAQSKTAKSAGVSLSGAIARFFGARDELAPDDKARLKSAR